MIRHLLTLTFRNFARYKTSFLVNLTSLSVGLACVLLVYLWVADELKVDKFFQNDARLYQVMNNMTFSQDIQTIDVTPVPLAPALAEDLPEVEYAVAVNDFFSWGSREGILSNGENHFKAKGAHAGKDYFQVFSYPLLAGSKESVLTDKTSIVLSDRMAAMLFGNADASIGQTLEWDHPDFEGPFQVSGVFQAPPASATAQFDVIFGLDVLLENDRYAAEWNGCYAQTFLLLKEGTDLRQFNEKIANFQETKNEALGQFELFAQRYSDRYLNGHYENGSIAGGRISYIKLFSLIGLFILLIACINFMNLSTARASLKIKEIGVKKTVGATRKALIFQFFFDALLVSFLAFQVALMVVNLFLPQINELTGKYMELQFGLQQSLVIGAIVILTGLVAGSYPAFYLSGFNPITVLKGKLNKATGIAWVRRSLVIFQFAVSAMFIVALLVVNDQIEYTQTKNLGYDRDNIVSFRWKGDLYSEYAVREEGKSNQQFETFMQEMKELPGVVNASSMTGSIVNKMYGQSGITWSGDESERNFLFQSPVIGPDMIETLGIELLEGRTFSVEQGDNPRRVILNEAAVKMMGLEDPVGKSMGYNGGSEIIGVVKDFHYGSLRQSVDPLFFRFEPNGRDILVKIKGGAELETMKQLDDLHAGFLPRHPFEYTFMDQDYQKLYESENQVAALSNYMAAIAIIISCLGLFGLATFTAERRSKEIGIRRIIGASIMDIMRMLSKDFTRTVLIAIAIALPVSFLILNKWLSDFAYSVELRWEFFAAAGLATLLIAWLTIGFQTFKAASINPIEFLQDE